MSDPLQEQLKKLEKMIERIEALFHHIDRPENQDFDARFEARRLAASAARELRTEFRKTLKRAIREAR